jgi:transposase
MSDRRKKHSPSEKARIALEAIKSELTSAQITSKYGIHASQVSTWKKQALAYLPDAFSDKGKQESTRYETQLAELYEQIGRLKVENDFLKKKFDVFRG